MKELMILFAKELPVEKIIEQLIEALQKYQCDPTKENKGGVSMWCAMFMSKEITDHKDPMEIIADMNKVERIRERMDSQNA